MHPSPTPTTANGWSGGPHRERCPQPLVASGTVSFAIERWAAAVNVPVDERVKPERFSRTVASHLLVLGYSASHLKAWAKGLYGARVTTADIADSAAAVARTPAQPYEVLVALEKVPQRQLAEPLEHYESPSSKIIGWWIMVRWYAVMNSPIRGGRYSLR